MAQPTTWLLVAPLLVASTAAAQPQLPARQRQDRRAALPAAPSEPMLELYVAAGNLTTVSFNAKLDPDSLVVDRTRFKWAEVSDHFLLLQPFADTGPGERLILQVGFKDRALPAKAVIAVVSKADVMDGNLEVDRRANAPEALLAALAQKEAELKDLKARCEGSGPEGLGLSQWLDPRRRPITLLTKAAAADASGLEVRGSLGYEGTRSGLVAIHLRNLVDQKPWVLGQARVTNATGAPVKVLSVWMEPAALAQEEEGLVMVETTAPPWSTGKRFTVELVDADGQRRLSLNLLAQ